MKVITASRVIRLVVVCTVILQVQSAPPEDSEYRQRATADRISPGTVKPIERRNVPEDVTDQPSDATKLKGTTSSNNSSKESDEKDDVLSTSESTEVTSDRISGSSDSDSALRSERDSDSEDSFDSEEKVGPSVQVVRRRSAEDDCDNTTSGNETGEDADDETDNTSEEDNGSTVEADCSDDTRRRRDYQNDVRGGERTKREAWGDSSQSDEDDGGYTREAAIVSPVRRRRVPDNKKNATTPAPIHYDDSIVDPFDDPKEEEVLSRMRRRAAETSTVTTIGGDQLVVVAPADVHVKDIPKALNNTVQTLKEQIDHFEEKAEAGLPTVPTVGVLVGQNTQQDKDTILHTLSSAQYIVH